MTGNHHQPPIKLDRPAGMAGYGGDDPFMGGVELGEGDDLLTGLPEGIVDDG